MKLVASSFLVLLALSSVEAFVIPPRSIWMVSLLAFLPFPIQAGQVFCLSEIKVEIFRITIDIRSRESFLPATTALIQFVVTLPSVT